ncbi:hypothetical protein BJ322DRAFT_310118 [Thelephora terrestris]|uniref:DUF6533 domain-containing protein n=1 Tax=Thelephora terrestris TaxID=56493 RepID=A0A9P6L2R9_9AGAM|nr:hypothetical protein BJ322DRAFT_310118 [Thelephora terrestris]
MRTANILLFAVQTPMDSVIQNGWNQLAVQYTDLAALTFLYYDYTLTFDCERRLFWSPHSFKQWGSILFFLNRYCGVIGNAPVFIQLFVQPGPALYLCKPVYSYHQILAVITQAIVVLTFVTRTYALYDRSRAVLAGLVSLALGGIMLGGVMIFQGKKLPADPALPEGSIGCPAGLSWSQSWRLAVAWGGLMVFDFITVIMTLVKTIQINRRCGRGHAIIQVLMRDGIMYFGIISLATLSNVLSFLHGTVSQHLNDHALRSHIIKELTRGVSTTITNALASVLVSRLMFNLREPRVHPSEGSFDPVSQHTLSMSTRLSSEPPSDDPDW